MYHNWKAIQFGILLYVVCMSPKRDVKRQHVRIEAEKMELHCPEAMGSLMVQEFGT